MGKLLSSAIARAMFDMRGNLVGIAGEDQAEVWPMVKTMADAGQAPLDKRMAKWNIARNKVRSGTGRARILFLTDSYGVGPFKSQAWAGLKLALESNGYACNFAAMGLHSNSPANLMTYDGRYTAITGFTLNRVQSIGRGTFESNAAGSKITFKPGVVFNSLKVGHYGFNSPTFAGGYTVKVDGVAIGATVQTQAAAPGFVETNFSGFAGTETSVIEITTVAGAGGGNLTILHSFLPYDSTKPAIDIFCSAQAGLQLSDHMGNTAPYQAATDGCELYPGLAAYQFDLVVSSFLINESDPSKFAAAIDGGRYEGCLKSLVNRQANYGSTLFVRPPRSDVTAIPAKNQDMAEDVLLNVADELDVAVVDYTKRIGTYEQAKAAYPGSTMYVDDRHIAEAVKSDLGWAIGNALAW